MKISLMAKSNDKQEKIWKKKCIFNREDNETTTTATQSMSRRIFLEEKFQKLYKKYHNNEPNWMKKKLTLKIKKNRTTDNQQIQYIYMYKNCFSVLNTIQVTK